MRQYASVQELREYFPQKWAGQSTENISGTLIRKVKKGEIERKLVTRTINAGYGVQREAQVWGYNTQQIKRWLKQLETKRGVRDYIRNG